MGHWTANFHTIFYISASHQFFEWHVHYSFLCYFDITAYVLCSNTFTFQPSYLQDDDRLSFFITTLLRQAPAIRLHKPAINLQPIIDYLRSLYSHTITLATLQSKLAFLLGITCFLQPSDLQRIPLASVLCILLIYIVHDVHLVKLLYCSSTLYNRTNW